jgi:hypothetical protein
MNPQHKNRLVAALSLFVILVSCGWIYFTQVRDALHNKGLHQHIGQVMAEQAAQAVGPKGKIVSIAIDSKEWPELKVQLQSFKTNLKKLGNYEIRDYTMDTKDQPKYGVGTGLSGRRYVRTVKKNLNADLFVSFIGAPKLTPEEIAELGVKPKLVVESRSGDNLSSLFENKLAVAAVVARFQFPAPGPEKPRTIDEWFQKRYQVVTPSSLQAVRMPE